MTDHKPCDPAYPCSTAFDLASERNTLDGLWAETKDRLDAALAQVARLREALAAIVARSETGELGTSRTRDMASLARAALAETAAPPAVQPDPTPGSDGWIKWGGGECPVAEGTRVSVRFREGDIDEDGVAGIWNWDWVFGDGDIVAYRVLDAKAGDRS